MKPTIPLLALLLTLLCTSSAPGQSAEQSVKLTHETLLAAISTGNLTMAQALIHPRALGFFRNSANLAQLSPSYGPSQALPSVLADLGRFTATPAQTVYGVAGSTAVVAMSTVLQEKDPKSDKNTSVGLRSTYIYVLENGNWRLFSWHTSVSPLELNNKK
jgi:hypothetical protein